MYGEVYDLLALYDAINLSSDIKTWIQAGEAERIDGLDNVNFEYGVLFDLCPNIISKIPPELLNDANGNEFLVQWNEISTNIVTYTLEHGIVWNIDLSTKLLWIALMLACKSAPKVIPTLINTMTDHDYIFSHEDNSGNNCFTIACSNIESVKMLIQHKSFDNFLVANKKNVTPIDLLALNGNLSVLIEEKTVDVEILMNYTSKQKAMTILHLCSLSINAKPVLDSLIASGKLTREFTYRLDAFGNTALLTACSRNLASHFTIMIEKGLYSNDVINLKNNDNNDYIDYAIDRSIIKPVIAFVSQDQLVEKRLYKYIKDVPTLKLFVHSHHFNYDNLLKIISEEQRYHTLFAWICSKQPFLNYILNELNDENISKVIEQIFINNKYILAMAFELNFRSAETIINSKYISTELFKEKYTFVPTETASTLIEKIIVKNSEYINTYRDEFKNLIESLINCTHISSDLINDDFIIFCINYFPEFLKDLIDHKLLDNNYINIIEKLLELNDNEKLSNVIVNSKVLYNKLVNNKPLLLRIIRADDELVSDFLQCDILTRDIIELFTHNGIIDIRKTLLDYDIFEGYVIVPLTKALDKSLLNAFNSDYGSILNNIYCNHILSFFIDNKDFDHSLFYKKLNDGTSYFTNCCVNCTTANRNIDFNQYDDNIVEELMNHFLFTKEEYDYVVKNDSFRNSIFNNEITADIFINHPYFDETVIEKDYNEGNNLFTHLIKKNFDKQLVSYLINHKTFKSKHFTHQNNNGDNCLLIGLRNEKNIAILIASEYFTSEMMTIKNLQNVSPEDELYECFNYDFFHSYCQSFPKSDLLVKQFQNGNTFAHKIIQNINANTNTVYNNLIEVFKILPQECLILRNNNGNTVLDEIVSGLEQNKVLQELFDSLKLKKEWFYMTNSKEESTIIRIIRTTNFNNFFGLDRMIQKGFIDDNDSRYLLKIIVYEQIDIFPAFNRYFDVYKILLESEINGSDPLFFRLVTHNKWHTYFNFISRESLYLQNTKGRTLLFEIIVTLNKELVENLILNKIIDESDISIYLYELTREYPSAIKFLIKLIPDLFIANNLINCITACINNSELLDIFFGSKHFSTEEFYQVYEKPELRTSLINSTIGLKYMFKYNLVKNEFIKENNYQIIWKIEDPSYLSKILNILTETDKQVFELQDPVKHSTIFHKYASYSGLITFCIKKYLEISDVKNNALLKTDYNKKTFLDYLVKYKYSNDIEKVLKILDTETLSNLITNQDCNGNTFIMECCKNVNLKNILPKIASLITQDVLLQYNNQRILVYTFIICQLPELLPKLPKLDKSIIGWLDSEGYDIFMTATIFNSDGLKYLLSVNDYTDYYENFDKCLVYACQFNAESFKLLLNFGKNNISKCYGFVDFIDQGIPSKCYANILQIACRYNSDVTRYLINSSYDLQPLINEVIENVDGTHRFNAFKLAVLYEPESVELLLNSKYGSPEMIKTTNELCEQNSCLYIALKCQMSSYNKIITSKHFNESMYSNVEIGDLRDKYMNEMPSRYVQHLYKYKDTVCDDFKDACSICYENKNKVVFAPCGHKACITCSTKLTKCPQCRASDLIKIVF